MLLALEGGTPHTVGGDLLKLGVSVILFALNAFFVLAEFAIVKVRTTRIQELAQGGGSNARVAFEVLRRMDAYLAACQLGITVASLAIGWLAEPSLASLLERLFGLTGWKLGALSHGLAFGIALVAITSIHVVMGEQAPKMLGIRKSEASILLVARPLRWFYLASYPLLAALNGSTNALLRLFGMTHASEHELAHSEEELKMILGASHEQGAFTLSRLLMMENVLDFGTLTVEDVFTPAERVVFLDPARPWAENLDVIRRTLHSRYPLKAARVERAVHIKDVLLALSKGATPDLAAVARPIYSVPPTLSLEGLLHHFSDSATHMAVVEREGLRGIVTLEDVVEELVGTIRDEHEKVQNYRLQEIVPAPAIVLDLAPQPKDGAIRELARRLGAVKPEIDVERTVAAIMKREKMASTGIGEGIALPHGRVDGLRQPWGAVGRCAAGMDFASLDGKPVNLVFLILTPPHDEGAHVHILEKISNLLASDYLRQRLSDATTPEEVLEVFRMSDKSLQA